MSSWVCDFECGHVDCYEDRGRDSKCLVCGEPVPFAEIFRVQQGRGLYAAHRTCRKRPEPNLSQKDVDSKPAV